MRLAFGNWFLTRMLKRWYCSGVKIIVNISWIICFDIVTSLLCKLSKASNPTVINLWFCFLISIEITENESGWLVYLFFKDDRVAPFRHNWLQSLKRVCLVFHHCVFYKFVVEASILIINPLNPCVLCIGWYYDRLNVIYYLLQSGNNFLSSL